jgi:hypothetical protein
MSNQKRMHCSAVSSKVSAETLDGSVIGHFSEKIRNDGNNGNKTGRNCCSYCRKRRHVRQNYFKLKKKEFRYCHNQDSNSNNSKSDQEIYDPQDVVFAATSKNENFTEDISGFLIVELVRIYWNSSKGVFNVNVEDIKESINVGKGKFMMTTKVGSMKCRVIQLFGFGLDITIHEVKFVREMLVNCSILA